VALQEPVLDLVIGVAQMMVVGELTQRDCLGITGTGCIERVDRQAAGLFSVCRKLGAVAAGADKLDGKKLGDFAWNVAMAFQLIDDVMEFVSRDFKPGKQVCGKLKDGKVTLAFVYALEQASVSERNMVAGVLRDRSHDAVPYVLALVDRYGGTPRTHARALQFTDRARQILAAFPRQPRARRFVSRWLTWSGKAAAIRWISRNWKCWKVYSPNPFRICPRMTRILRASARKPCQHPARHHRTQAVSCGAFGLLGNTLDGWDRTNRLRLTRCLLAFE
jgi:hypothetical protein